MKIVYLNVTATIGGAERALLDLIRVVARTRRDWELRLVTGAEGELAAEARTIEIPVDVLPLPTSLSLIGDAGAGGPAGNLVSPAAILARLGLSAPSMAAYLCRFRCFLLRCGPHVIHSNDLKSHVLTALAAPRRARIIWHVHDYVHPRPLMSRLMRIHAGRCAIAIANSQSVAGDLKLIWGERPPVLVSHNSVDMQRFSPEGPTLDLDRLASLPPAEPGTIRVGIVATMARWKGHEVFLKALAMLFKKSRIRGYVVGGPVYTTRNSQYSLAELQSLAGQYGLNGNVGFTGYVKNPASAIRALDIVVHASTQPEPFGLVIAEAMACGKPVIASRAGGVVEIIAENQTALFHDPGNAEELASRVALLASDHRLRTRLANEGRRWAERHFDPGRLVKELVPIYKSLASSVG